MHQSDWQDEYITLKTKVTLLLTLLDSKSDGRLEDASFSMVKVIESLKLLTNYERLDRNLP